MIVLALNCGSSSVKVRVFDVDAGAPDQELTRSLASGRIEGLPSEEARLTWEAGEALERDTVAATGHDAGVRHLLTRLADLERGPIEAVGHRVVHGGDRFTRPVLIDAGVLMDIERLEELAPLHNAPSLAGIRAARTAVGAEVPMVAVFDTAFHASLPDRASRYAIPSDLARRHGVRRFGFHGLSYQSLLSRYGRLTGTPPEEATIVALHLGSGCSAAAIRGGRSVDTSMGFTPLEGLVMGTRSGDLDPALVGYLARKEGVPVETVEEWLNERSGLQGLSGLSHDVRKLLALEAEHAGARLAIEVFCYRARKYLGAYLAVLGGAQAVVLTGGVGENSPEIRARILEDMEWCGLRVDPARNATAVGIAGSISPPDTPLPAYVIPTDEELIIARETARCLERMTP